VNERVTIDIEIMKLVAGQIGKLPSLKWISLPEATNKFGELMKSHLDLTGEARATERFIENFKYR
jgi:predicted unusual protein kinase regulating ubiquinone biosynthesis (AarF/ABC1/UbiB family)